MTPGRAGGCRRGFGWRAVYFIVIVAGAARGFAGDSGLRHYSSRGQREIDDRRNLTYLKGKLASILALDSSIKNAASSFVTASKNRAPFSAVADRGSPAPESLVYFSHGRGARAQPARIPARRNSAVACAPAVSI